MKVPMTELGNTSIRRADRVKQNLGEVSVGDVRELTLTVKLLSGYEAPP